ncbi:MAG: protoheme IX farnesyltransferase [Bacteroidetes bacterium]|nr:protoheme IX farnesyltransferase [Bacteroidota bacterium]
MINKLNNFLGLLAELGKVKITFAVAFTTITGYVLAKGGFDSGLLLPTLGIFILACGSSAINHFQEQSTDAIMDRTKSRPLPSGRIKPGTVLFIALSWVILGSWILFISSGFIGMQLGLLALLWYNGIYTPLKKKTAFAVVPGSVIGAIPPAVGWVAGGGDITDPRILLVAFFFFIWQVPHFWLLSLKYGKQYEEAGLPSITSIYSQRQIKRMTFVWTLATAVTVTMVPYFGVVSSLVSVILILLSSIWLMITFSVLVIKPNAELNPGKYFMKINYFALMIMISLLLEPYL